MIVGKFILQFFEKIINFLMKRHNYIIMLCIVINNLIHIHIMQENKNQSFSVILIMYLIIYEKKKKNQSFQTHR